MASRESYTHVDCRSAGRPLTEAISKDHDELRDYFNAFKAATSDADKQKWANLYVNLNARHAVAEELFVYPVFEEKGLKNLVEGDLEAHQKIKNGVNAFQGLSASSPDFANKFQSAFDALWEHVEHEEAVDLPALEDALSVAESAKLAQTFNKARFFLPTRAHPNAPAKPPFETAAALLAAPLDRLMDLFRTFPSAEEQADAHQLQKEYKESAKSKL